MKYSSFFKYRGVWMFVAIIFVFVSHTNIQTGSAFLNYFCYFANFCVDIFVFASGVGCYMSYSRDRDYIGFLKRRALKVLPVLLPVLIVWSTVMLIRQKISPLSAVCNLLGLQIFLPKKESFNWYISCILVLYFSTPLFARLAERVKSRAAAFLTVLLLSLAAFPTISLNFGSGIHLVLLRLPEFFFGMYLARCSKEKEKMPIWLIVLFLALIPVGAHIQMYTAKYNIDRLISWGMYWYPSSLITPGLCVIISFLSGLLDRIQPGRYIVKLFKTVGGYTLEIYLVHFSALELAKWYYDMYSPGYIKPVLLFFALVAVTVSVLRFISVLVNRDFEKT